MSDAPVSIPAYLAARERARWAGRWVQVICVLGAAACVAVAGLQIRALNRIRSESQMRLNTDVLKEVPPDIAVLNTMLGPLRGVWITSLWIQADKLKEQNRFYDALQRAQWICRLQPRFPAVWTFQAWNMAYNISVTKHTPEERWKWVSNGAHLLQQQAIPLNPRTLELYKELAWIYFHKVGDVMDDMHWAYKSELAAEFQRLLGEPDPGLDAEGAIGAFRPVAEAPVRLADLTAADPQAGEFLRRLKETGYECDARMLADYHDARMVEMHRVKLKGDQKVDIPPEQKALLNLMRDEKFTAQQDKALAFARAGALRDRHGMDAAFMLTCMERFGPLDWRVPFAHAAYWGYLGDQRTQDVRNRNDSTELNNDRVILFCLINMFARGRLLFMLDLEQPNQSYYYQLSDLRFVDYVHKNYLAYGKKHDEQAGDTAGEALKAGHINTLSDAIVQLYFRGRLNPEDLKKAEHYYEYLREHYREPDGTVRWRYRQPLDQFVRTWIDEVAETFKATVELLTTLTGRALMHLATGDESGFVDDMSLSKEVYDRFMRGKATEMSARIKLPRYERVVGQNLFLFLTGYPIPTYYKGRVWAHFLLGNEDERNLVRMVYDQVRGYLSAECDAQGYDVSKLFAEPPGMEEYRREHAAEEPFEPPHVPRPEEREAPMQVPTLVE